MFSVAPNIVLAPNMTQNAERKHRTQDTDTAHFRSWQYECVRNPSEWKTILNNTEVYEEPVS